jgi:hypothetical protein
VKVCCFCHVNPREETGENRFLQMDTTAWEKQGHQILTCGFNIRSFQFLLLEIRYQVIAMGPQLPRRINAIANRVRPMVKKV